VRKEAAWGKLYRKEGLARLGDWQLGGEDPAWKSQGYCKNLTRKKLKKAPIVGEPAEVARPWS